MIESSLRPAFQRIFVKPALSLGGRYLSANGITICALIVGLIAAGFLSMDYSYLDVVLLLLSGYLDILDGSVARLQNNSTAFGTVLDILSDRLVESSIVIALFLRDPSLGLICLLMSMSMLMCISSFLLVGIFSDKQSEKSFHYSSGLMERAESFIFFILMMLLPDYVLILGVVFTVLVWWTMIFRAYQFYQYQQESL